jgi:hypothetical protein
MKLPNPEQAFVDIAKLRDYSLNPSHKEGRHKARVFASVLGLGLADAGWLREQLMAAARQYDCQVWKKTEHGQRYLIDFTLTRQEKTARLRSVWNVRPAENFPRLITCYVL